jgi:hypothetical protein
MEYIPSNNCYIFSLNFRKTLVDERVAFQIDFNFGGNSFENLVDGISIKNKL